MPPPPLRLPKAAGILVVLLATFLGGNRRAEAEPPAMKEAAARPRIHLQTEDERFSLGVGGFVQMRYAEPPLPGGADSISVPRIRLFGFGRLGSERLRYRVMVGRSEYGRPDQPDFELFDAYLEYWASRGAKLRVGQFKVPVFREWIESARLIGSVERSHLTRMLLPGRSVGALLYGSTPENGLEYSLGLFHRPAPGEVNHPSVSGRAVWNLTGESIDGELAFGEAPLAVSVGASALVEPGLRTSMGAEVAMRWKGSDLTAEAMARREEGGWSHGGYLRADQYLAPLRSTVGGRFSTAKAPGYVRDQLEMSLGFLPLRHDLKLTTDLGVERTLERPWTPFARVQVQAGF